MGRKPLFKPATILALIQDMIVERGEAPTLGELCKRLGVSSKKTVHRYLVMLEEQGSLERGAGARAIRLLRGSSPGFETVRVPLIGTAPAGRLKAAEENVEGWLQLPRSYIKPPSAKFFLLRVRGNSMNRQRVQNDFIGDKDLVLVQQQSTADPNDVVVALIDGQATIKRLVKGPDYFALMPNSTNNEEYPPILLGDSARVQGVVRRVIKLGTKVLEQKEV